MVKEGANSVVDMTKFQFMDFVSIDSLNSCISKPRLAKRIFLLMCLNGRTLS